MDKAKEFKKAYSKYQAAQLFRKLNEMEGSHFFFAEAWNHQQTKIAELEQKLKDSQDANLSLAKGCIETKQKLEKAKRLCSRMVDTYEENSCCDEEESAFVDCVRDFIEEK